MGIGRRHRPRTSWPIELVLAALLVGLAAIGSRRRRGAGAARPPLRPATAPRPQVARATPARTAAAALIAVVTLSAVMVGARDSTPVDAAPSPIDSFDQPDVSINNVSITEGDSGATTATLTLSLTFPDISIESFRPSVGASLNVSQIGSGPSVVVTTADGSATAGSDYVALSTTVEFNDSDEETVTVQILGDRLFEGTENFFVNLSSPNGLDIVDGRGVVTIVDNEGQPTLSVDDVVVAESGSAVFTVTLSTASSMATQVSFATADGTATAGADYQSRSGLLSIPPGALSATISVPILDDTLFEGDETFLIKLSSPVGATIADAQGAGTIRDNDPKPTLSINNVVVAENGATAVFTVSLSAASGLATQANFATADGTATAGADYQSRSGSVLIPAGSLAATISVPILTDSLDEGDETFLVTLSNPVNATLADPQGVGRIIDVFERVTTPTLSITDARLVEADADCAFTVNLSELSGVAVEVRFATSNGSATSAGDYLPTGGILVIPAGARSGTILVPVRDDLLVETDETFVVSLSAPVNATIADGVGICTIIDNDTEPTTTGTTTTTTTVPPSTVPPSTVPPTTVPPTTVPPTTVPPTTVPPTTV
ncbi:MAG: Calx-beta domain-containing protein, partial [Acidimicrobiales bacterium]